MIGFSNAKINIGLSVLDKRPDGFHNLKSIFYPIPLNDIIEIQKSDKDSFDSYPIQLSDNNLITQARDLLRSRYHFGPVSIVIHKQIPLGSGLGGGSSNAVTTLKILINLFELDISDSELFEVTLELGSDCPFFLKNSPQEVSGRGDLLQDSNLSLKEKYIALINPGIHISTAEAFSNLTKRQGKPEMNSWTFLSNDFQAAAERDYPAIKEALDELNDLGAIFTSLSGTGSTVYGIFDSLVDFKTGANRWLFQLD